MLQAVLKQQENICILLHGAMDTTAVTEASPLATGEQAELMQGTLTGNHICQLQYTF